MGSFHVKRAKKVALDFIVTKSDGSVENITGALFRFTAKKTRADADADAIVDLTSGGGAISIVSAPAGSVRVALPDGWGASLPKTRIVLVFDLQFTRSGGDGPYVIDSGTLVSEPEAGTADPA